MFSLTKAREGVVWANWGGLEGPSREPIPIPSTSTLWAPSPSSCESTMVSPSSSLSGLGCRVPRMAPILAPPDASTSYPS
ncbi:hypothetical protein Tco_1422356 [Tanacetum coccineum]